MHPVSCFVNEAFKTNQPHCGVVNANKLCVFFSLLCQSIDSIGTDDCASESTIHGFDCNRMATDLWVANCKLQSLLCASFDAKKASSDVIWFDYSWIKRIMSHVCGHRAAAKCDSKKDQRNWFEKDEKQEKKRLKNRRIIIDSDKQLSSSLSSCFFPCYFVPALTLMKRTHSDTECGIGFVFVFCYLKC